MPDRPITVRMAGISHCDGSYHIKRECSPITVIEYVTSGVGFITVEGREETVTADTVYILKKGEPHSYRSDAREPWEKIFMNIEGDLPLELIKSFDLEKEWRFDGRGLKDIFIKVAETVRSKECRPIDEATLEALFFEALARISHRNVRSVHSREAVRIKDYIDLNLNKSIGNKELAALIFRSADYTVKLFKKEYGTTPYDYAINQKMSVAKHLIRNTATPIRSIAETLGYHDISYFSGLFKTKCGMSPREYRNSRQ